MSWYVIYRVANSYFTARCPCTSLFHKRKLDYSFLWNIYFEVLENQTINILVDTACCMSYTTVYVHKPYTYACIKAVNMDVL